MPKTTEQRLKEITRPAVCDLLPVRDFLDDVMIRADGAYVAGFHLGGALSYFMDDDGRNQTKRTLESLFLTIPEESMRVQFRYEVILSRQGGAVVHTRADVPARWTPESYTEFVLWLHAKYVNGKQKWAQMCERRGWGAEELAQYAVPMFKVGAL